MALALAELRWTDPSLQLVLAATVAQAEQLESQIKFFLGDPAGVVLFPDLEVLPYDSFSPHQDLISARLGILRDLARGSLRTLITAVPTLLPRLPPREYLQRHDLRIAQGEVLTLEELQRRLDQAGYLRVGQVTVHGDYTVRGSLVDFFPMGYELPVRVDFLDDTVESIRSFDPDTQLSADHLKLVDTLPAREMPIDPESVKQFRQRYRRRFEGNPAHSLVYREVSERRLPDGIESYLPLFFEQTATLWDYLPDDALVICAGDTDTQFEQSWQQIQERFEQLGSDAQRPLLRPDEVHCTPEEHRAALARRGVVQLESGAIPFPEPDSAAVNLAAAPAPMLLVNPRDEQPARHLLDFMKRDPGRLLFAVSSSGHREMLAEVLTRAGAPPVTVASWPEFLDGSYRTAITVAPLEQGVLLPGARTVMLSEQELFGRPLQRRLRRRRTRDAEAVLQDLTDLRAGAPVVHIDHGVGRYVGLTRLDIGGVTGEFVTLEYAGGDRLHVPVSALNLVSRYTGAAPELAPLHRLGTDQWQRARRRAAERVRDVAAELLELYSRRAARTGRSASADPHSYESFASGFSFTLTDDQATAIDEVIRDLQSPLPMDRLVCGDVGFGKTEVALRAAFVAVMSGRQVAVLVPTTLLAQQHYETFADRFADWPVQIEALSRFRSRDQQRQILERLAAGSVDIVIGTHRLLQRDVRFKELGLVIVDEEHRFGVRHKERLKELRAEVDLLTLTATPIPRTLNMALGGLRQLSLITTPPESRLAIRTFITTWSAHVIREACLRELKRGGQVYFVHNRIQDIDRIGAQVARIVPEARIEIAHGQMSEKDLERVMLDFYHRRFQILVCTAIIESGLDVPIANTIIIDHAEQFGLAQLHQLRGRVGRSHHQAFAYLIAPPREALQADAKKRLEALESLEDLGAGFVLATHDLEIRGAGELLGEEQSGQIQEIGFALYNEMLSRTVDALRQGLEADPETTGNRGTEVELHIAALLPDDYLPDVHLRLVLYKRIASCASDDELLELGREFEDRFGPLPEPTRNLLRVTALQLRARQAGITRLQAGATGGSVEFAADAGIDPARIVRLIEADPSQYRFDPRQRLVFRADLVNPQIRFDYVARLIEKLDGRRLEQTCADKLRAGVA
jgi:transcription-repair coupling factor (superfamily II helicase)